MTSLYDVVLLQGPYTTEKFVMQSNNSPVFRDGLSWRNFVVTRSRMEMHGSAGVVVRNCGCIMHSIAAVDQWTNRQ
jgi:hypothetical protein